MNVAPVQSRLRARYAETDRMGVVYHANYLVWMEIGRTDYCRARGFRYADMERDADARLPVVEVRCRYVASARYDDDILVLTTLIELRSRKLVFHYEIRHAETNLPLAEGETTHIVVNGEGKPIRLPAKYFDMLSASSPTTHATES